jgi:hypothetical protein
MARSNHDRLPRGAVSPDKTRMKRIEAHLNPSRLDEVLEALVESGIGPGTCQRL